MSAEVAVSVSSWKARGMTSSLVDLALSSMALAVFARLQGYPPAAREASLKYSRLLRLAQEHIDQLATSQVDERNIDACLLAITLMGRYEGTGYQNNEISPDDSFQSIQTWSHYDGALAILRLWHDNPNHGTPSLVVRQARRCLMRIYLLRNRPLPDWLHQGEVFGEIGSACEFDRILVRVASTIHILTTLDRLQFAGFVTLNEQLETLDKELRDWGDQRPRECSPQRHILPGPGPWPRRDFYSSTVYTYPVPRNGASWCYYFAVRMLINSTRLKLLELAWPDPVLAVTYELWGLECLTRLQSMADMLASSLPFCLERCTLDETAPSTLALNTSNIIKPYLATLVIWPLTIAASLERLDSSLRDWFRVELSRLGTVTADGVLEVAAASQWASLYS